MRIVQVSPFFSPHAGGVESHVRTLAVELARRGHEVTVLTSRFRGNLPAVEQRDGYRILRAPTLGVLFNTPLDWGAGRVLRGLEADIVHLHFPPPLSSFFATQGLRDRRVPVCMTYHCDLFLAGRLGRGISWFYERTLLPPTLARVDRIIVHTQSYGTTSAVLRGRELEIIPSVVDLQRFRPGLDASGPRKKLGLQGKRVLVFIGRLVTHKGVDVLLRAVAELPQDVHLVVVGRGPRLVDLEGLARRVGVADPVHFCVPALYSCSDHYTFCDLIRICDPSRYDDPPFPYDLLR